MITDNEKKELIASIDVHLDIVRPHLLADGGNIEVVDITSDNVLIVKFLGNCKNCSMSDITMRAGVHEALRGKFPFIVAVQQEVQINS